MADKDSGESTGKPAAESPLPQQSSPEPAKEHAKKEQSNPTADSENGTPATPEHNKPDPQNSNPASNGPQEQDRAERWMIRWTGVVGVFTVVLAVATGISAYFLYETDVTLQETLKAQARSSERQLRAYVTVEPLGMEGVITPTLFEKALVRNTGQTPAYKIVVKWTFDIFDYPFPIGRTPVVYGDIPVVGEPIPRHFGAILGPGREVTAILRAERNFSPEEGTAISKPNPRKVLAGIGVVYYTDIFGGNHYTKFCHIFSNFGAQGTVSWCPYHNDAN